MLDPVEKSNSDDRFPVQDGFFPRMQRESPDSLLSENSSQVPSPDLAPEHL